MDRFVPVSNISNSIQDNVTIPKEAFARIPGMTLLLCAKVSIIVFTLVGVPSFVFSLAPNCWHFPSLLKIALFFCALLNAFP